MIDVHEIIRRSQAGESARKIARVTHINRKTVARYLEAAQLVLPSPDAELNDDLILAIKHEVQARVEPSTSASRVELHQQRTRIEGWLHHPQQPLRLTRIHELLQREGMSVSYTTLRRFAKKEFGFGERACTVLIADAGPAEEAQIDFGLMGKVTFEGVERKLWALIVTMVHSRFSFVWPTFTQTTNDVIEGLEAAWSFFGGIPKRIIPDNMTSVVIDPNPLDPKLGRVFSEYEQARKFFVDPARVRSPQDKGRVENQVPYVRERWFAGETFVTLTGAREHARLWCQELAGMRIHGTTRKRPREVYEAIERPLMRAAPIDLYEVPRWTVATVARDHHFQVDKALYSVPTQHIGQRVDVRIGASTVKVYGDDKVIAVHPRVSAGERQTNPEHYPKHKRNYATRSPQGLIEESKKHGTHVQAYAERLLGDAFAWTKMRQATALLALCERYGSARVEQACAASLSYDVVDVQRLGAVVKSAVKLETRAKNEGKLIVLSSRFARAPQAFATVGLAPNDHDPGGGT
ncbi:MAG: hypothetical protein RL701_6326 [Pseudomonadota bacterium]